MPPPLASLVNFWSKNKPVASHKPGPGKGIRAATIKEQRYDYENPWDDPLSTKWARARTALDLLPPVLQPNLESPTDLGSKAAAFGVPSKVVKQLSEEFMDTLPRLSKKESVHNTLKDTFGRIKSIGFAGKLATEEIPGSGTYFKARPRSAGAYIALNPEHPNIKYLRDNPDPDHVRNILKSMRADPKDTYKIDPAYGILLRTEGPSGSAGTGASLLIDNPGALEHVANHELSHMGQNLNPSGLLRKNVVQRESSDPELVELAEKLGYPFDPAEIAANLGTYKRLTRNTRYNFPTSDPRDSFIPKVRRHYLPNFITEAETRARRLGPNVVTLHNPNVTNREASEAVIDFMRRRFGLP